MTERILQLVQSYPLVYFGCLIGGFLLLGINWLLEARKKQLEIRLVQRKLEETRPLRERQEQMFDDIFKATRQKVNTFVFAAILFLALLVIGVVVTRSINAVALDVANSQAELGEMALARAEAYLEEASGLITQAYGVKEPVGLAKAVGPLKNAATIYSSLGEESKESEALSQLGTAYALLGRLSEARAVMAESLKRAQISGDSFSQLRATNNRLDLEMRAGELGTSELFEEALLEHERMAQGYQNGAVSAVAFLTLAEAYTLRRDGDPVENLSKAHEYLTQSVKVGLADSVLKEIVESNPNFAFRKLTKQERDAILEATGD